MVALVLSLTIFAVLRRLENQNARAAFRGAARQRLDSLEMNVRLPLDNILALEGFFDASHHVERRAFARFTARLLDHDKTIQALEWIPRVPNRRRSAFETEARRNGLLSFQIADRLPQGEPVRAAERAEYYPVSFVEPLRGNEKALGFDLASDPVRREALQNAAASGRITATSRIVLVQENSNQYGFLVFCPYYRGGGDPPVQSRREKVRGFLVGAFRMKALVEDQTSNAGGAPGLALAVFDRDGKAGQRLLYPKEARYDSVEDLPPGPVETATLTVAGRTWVAAIYPQPHAFAPVRWSSWSLLAAELMVVAISVTYLYHMLGRKQAIERTVAERTEALRSSEARLRGITDSARDAILMMDPRGAISYWNPAAEDILGYRKAEAIGQDLHRLLVPERYLDGYRNAFPEFVRTGCGSAIGKTLELPAQRKDGREIAVALSLSAICLNGEWHAIGILRDITERQRAEQALRDSDERFRQLADNVREVFFVMDPETNRTLYLSPGYEQIWGRSREDIYRSPLAWQEAIHPDDVAQIRPLAESRRQGEAAEFEYRIRTPDGLEKWIHSRSFPVRDQAGVLIRIVGIAEEITERKRYEAELIRAREGAEAANRAKSLFLATMSHELRTPLNAILGFAELLEVEMAGRGLHEWDADIQKIRRAGTHLLALISDVMDFSKIEAGKMELQPGSFDIAELVQEVVAGAETLAARNRVDLVVSCEPATLYGDRVRIGQCLFNLVGNACKFTRDGRVVVDAKREVCPDGGWYTVQVTDTGIGIRPEDMDKLFCYFTQLSTPKAHQYGGTGLGLAISRRLSRLMGGDITVASTVGQGSTFTFRFPAGIVADRQTDLMAVAAG